jgi:ABC-2 type transport system ATP-binding protein
MEEAEALAHRVAVIAGGRLVADDTPATLGGRARALTTVSWLDDGHPREASTDEPAAVVAELVGRYGGNVPGLTVTRPTLEDIYLDLIGQKS